MSLVNYNNPNSLHQININGLEMKYAVYPVTDNWGKLITADPWPQLKDGVWTGWIKAKILFIHIKKENLNHGWILLQMWSFLIRRGGWFMQNFDFLCEILFKKRSFKQRKKRFIRIKRLVGVFYLVV